MIEIVPDKKLIIGNAKKYWKVIFNINSKNGLNYIKTINIFGEPRYFGPFELKDLNVQVFSNSEIIAVHFVRDVETVSHTILTLKNNELDFMKEGF